jgi:hypothetical protein
VSRRVGATFWLESTLALITASLAVLTLVWRDWIERVFGFDPDRHSGSFEWALVAACCLGTVALVALARREWRMAAVAA